MSCPSMSAGDYRESFGLLQAAAILPSDLTVRLRRSVGLRNVLAHEYSRVDPTWLPGRSPLLSAITASTSST